MDSPQDLQENKIYKLENLLRSCHSLLDAMNQNIDNEYCHFCDEKGYDGDGLIHSDSCIIRMIRLEVTGLDT